MKTETEGETQYFIIAANGLARRVTVEDIVAQEYDIDSELAVEVDTVEDTFYIESTDWFSSEGICRLTVNSFPLETALRIFGETVKAFEKAESETR